MLWQSAERSKVCLIMCISIDQEYWLDDLSVLESLITAIDDSDWCEKAVSFTLFIFLLLMSFCLLCCCVMCVIYAWNLSFISWFWAPRHLAIFLIILIIDYAIFYKMCMVDWTMWLSTIWISHINFEFYFLVQDYYINGFMQPIVRRFAVNV